MFCSWSTETQGTLSLVIYSKSEFESVIFRIYNAIGLALIWHIFEKFHERPEFVLQEIQFSIVHLSQRIYIKSIFKMISKFAETRLNSHKKWMKDDGR